MELKKLDNFPIDATRVFGGATGPKFCILINNVPYMMKGQQNLKLKQFKNVEISYANDPVSEYIGSHIYEYYRVPVHDTLLGTYKGKLVVCCKDISVNGSFIEFKLLRNSIMDSEYNVDTSGMSTRLIDIFAIINNSNAPINRNAVKERFWLMFVIDAVIGNSDRNNGNWGFYKNGNSLELLPVYDNGGCLNNKKSDRQLQDALNDNISDIALNYTTNYISKGKIINPLCHIEKNLDNPYIRSTLLYILSFKYDTIYSIIDYVKPVISDVRATYYKEVIRLRLEYLQSIADNSYLVKSDLFCKEHNILYGMAEVQFRNDYTGKEDYSKEFYDWLMNGNYHMI